MPDKSPNNLAFPPQISQKICVLRHSGQSIVVDERGVQDGPFENELKGIHAEATADGQAYMKEIAEIFKVEYQKGVPSETSDDHSPTNV